MKPVAVSSKTVENKKNVVLECLPKDIHFLVLSLTKLTCKSQKPFPSLKEKILPNFHLSFPDFGEYKMNKSQSGLRE